MINPFKWLRINNQIYSPKDSGAVRFDENMQLSNDEKARVRNNIGVSAGGVSSVNGKVGDVELNANDVGALPSSTAVDKVQQKKTDPTNYSYWRGLLIGSSSTQNEGGSLSDITDISRVFDNIKVQPSSGTIKANKFKGNLEGNVNGNVTGNVTGDVTGNVTGTASGNYVLPNDGIPASDLEDKYAGANTAGGAAELTCAIPYGEIESNSTSTNLIATVPGVHELKDGVICYIRNDAVTSATGCTLNINGLGAKPIYNSNSDATRVTSGFTAAQTYIFVYNEKRVSGGCWDMYLGQVNSNTIGYQVRTNSSTMPVADTCYRYRLLFTSVDGQKFVPANADTQTSAAKSHTTNTRPIDPFGSILYYQTTTALSAGNTPSKTILWQQYVVPLGYSFNNANSALALTVNKPVYITATPQDDGSAVLDYFTQDLPNSEDGKIYIFLGIASSATEVEMQIVHPVYEYRNGAIRLYSNSGLNILSYGNSTWNDFMIAYKANKVVYCKASSNADPSVGSQNRRAFLTYVDDEANPTEVEFQYYRSINTHTSSQQGDQIFIYKLTNADVWTVAVREAASKVDAGTGLTSSYSNGELTLSADGNLLPSEMAFYKSNVTDGNSISWTAPKPSRGLIFISSAGITGRGIYFYSTSTSGNTSYSSAFNASGVTISNSSNVITVANSTGYAISVFIMYSTT